MRDKQILNFDKKNLISFKFFVSKNNKLFNDNSVTDFRLE